MRIALFITCFNDMLFPKTGQAAVAVLERLGHTVDFDPRQTCCGQMHANAGYPAEALTLVRRFVEVFRDAERIVVPSTSCVATIRTLYPRLAEADPPLLLEVTALIPRVFEFSQFLTQELGVEDVGAYYPHRVTYHASCNALRALRLGDAPVALLRAVRGLDYVELPSLEVCCGFGGTFAIGNAEVSTAMLADKMCAVIGTGAEVVTGGDNSCLMHIAGGLSRLRAGVRAMHLAEVLACT